MPDDVSDIADYYDEDPRDEHNRLEEHQLERDLTWRYLSQHLPPGGAVLEVGAATGRYSLELARRGFSVTAIDLSPRLVERAQEGAAEAGLEHRLRFLVGDARSLNVVTQDRFDAVLLMGPLYHLVEKTDRETALLQAHERLHSGGLIFTAVLSRLGVLGDLLKRAPEWIEDEPTVRALLNHGRRPDDAPAGGFRGYFARMSEIVPLHEAAGFHTLTLASLEPVISADDESFNRLKGHQRELWLDLLQSVGSDESIVGASRHVLYIGKKP